jgi:hypothetical protein
VIGALEPRLMFSPGQHHQLFTGWHAHNLSRARPPPH